VQQYLRYNPTIGFVRGSDIIAHQLGKRTAASSYAYAVGSWAPRRRIDWTSFKALMQQRSVRVQSRYSLYMYQNHAQPTT